MSDTDIVEVMVFGDSITYGAWDNHGGWVQRLREAIDVKNLVDENVAYFFYNLGVVDDTSTGIANRMSAELKARRYVNIKQARIVMVCTGLNDSEILLKKGEVNRVSKTEFEKNLLKIVEIAENDADGVIFVGPTPVDEPRAEPVPWEDDKAYRNKVVKEYDNIIQSVCKKKKLHFIEIFDHFIKLDYPSLLEDGLHPGPAGHLIIYELVRKYLVENKIINFEFSGKHWFPIKGKKVRKV